MKILITGGAGFIGKHLTQCLLSKGHEITVLDNFLPQVHGDRRTLAKDIAQHVRLVNGDIADSAVLATALEGAEGVVHLAAETGTGQSMYEVSRYARTNMEGTAQLYEQIIKKSKRIERIVFASSRAIYGEGAYSCERDGIIYPQPRSSIEKQSGSFDPLCPVCGGACDPVGTPEEAPSQPSSFYGLTKLTQEQMVLLFGKVLHIPSTALRYQNVFGPGQSLRNPYTGILAIFSNLARTRQPIHVFEDGMESRDFVYIHDVVAATTTALLSSIQGSHVVNIGSGEQTTVLEAAEQVNAHFGGHTPIEVTGAFREGDIRHGFADLTRARKLLGYKPASGFSQGLKSFLVWAEQTEPITSGYENSLKEMRNRGLLND